MAQKARFFTSFQEGDWESMTVLVVKLSIPQRSETKASEPETISRLRMSLASMTRTVTRRCVPSCLLLREKIDLRIL